MKIHTMHQKHNLNESTMLIGKINNVSIMKNIAFYCLRSTKKWRIQCIYGIKKLASCLNFCHNLKRRKMKTNTFLTMWYIKIPFYLWNQCSWFLDIILFQLLHIGSLYRYLNTTSLYQIFVLCTELLKRIKNVQKTHTTIDERR